MADAIVGVYRLDGRTVGELQLRAMVDFMAYPRAAPITLWARGPVGFAAVGVVKREAVEERSNGVHVLHLGNAIVVNAHDDTLLDLLAADPSLQNLDRLSGAFCGGLWDDENRRLVCFRDHLGVNPLYYRYRVNDYFIFASTISALLAYMKNEERVAVDEERLGDFLLHLPPSIGSTFFRDVRRVPPAHKLVVGASGLQLQRFWRPELSEHPPTSDADFAAAFKVLFEGAVRRSYANSSSLGTMLSGGMDSSSIACVASDLLGGSEPLHSFTYLYGADPSDDERDYAKAVIDAKKLSPHFIRTDQAALFDDADRLLRVAEEPYEHPGYATAWPLSVAVRDAGISTLLDGTLGDSVLSYDTWFIESLMRRGQLMTAVRETVLFVRRQDEWASPFPLLWNDGLKPLIADFIPSGGPAPNDVDDVVHPDFAQRTRLAERQQSRGRTAGQSKLPDALKLYLGLSSAESVALIEVRHKTSLALGFRLGLPFADKDLIEFCIRLPLNQRVRDRWTRFLLRRALRESLPEKILLRGNKWSSGSAMRSTLASSLDSLARERIMQSAKRLDGVIAPDSVDRALKKLTLDPEQATLSDVLKVWMPYILARWLDTFGAHM